MVALNRKFIFLGRLITTRPVQVTSGWAVKTDLDEKLYVIFLVFLIFIR